MNILVLVELEMIIILLVVRTVATDEHPLEILLESATEGRMAKLILRDNLTGSIDVSVSAFYCVCQHFIVCVSSYKVAFL